MADGKDLQQRLHPDDLAAVLADVRGLFAALMRGTQSSVPVYPPTAPKPPLFEGREDTEAVAKLIASAKDEMRREFRDLMRDENKNFLSEAEIEEKIDDRFDDLGLPTDTKENRRATGDRIRRILRWEKIINIVMTGAIVSGLGSAGWALARLVGFNPPPPGSH